jgi:hypothetical protein
LKKGAVEEKIFSTGPTRAAQAEKNYLDRHDKHIEPTKERPLLFVLFESPSTSVSKVNSGHLYLILSILAQQTVRIF